MTFIFFKFLFLTFFFTTKIYGKNITSLCDKPINNPYKSDNVEEHACECHTENSIWGELVLVIDCSYKLLENSGFYAEILPNFTVSLDMSYNKFTLVPIFEDDELIFLDASYNSITTLVENNFKKLPNLKHLYLSDNQINHIDTNAFNGLSELTELNLARNDLHQLGEHIFEPMRSLKTLYLSRNTGLSETFNKVGVDLFAKLGVTPNLNKLEIENSNLTTLNIGRGSWLTELYLSGNSFTKLQDMPQNIRILDISRNKIEKLTEQYFIEMPKLEMILMQDMNELTEIHRMSLYPLPNLNHLSFRGCKKLKYLDPEAFGDISSETNKPKLDILNLQGTGISTLNESLFELLKDTKAIDLDGAPLECDCNLRWLKQLTIETNGQCRSPKHLRATLVSGVPIKNFQCRWFPKWVYTTINVIMILVILVLCSLGVSFVFMKMKRTSDVQFKTKNNEYAPIPVQRTSNSAYY